MKTVARPATVEPGSFVRATPASTAASYWIGPSPSSSGARERTSSGGPRTPSTPAPAPPPGLAPGAARPGRVGQHRHPRLDPELRGGGRRRDRDVRELLRGRVRV